MFIQIFNSLDYANEYVGICTGLAYSGEDWPLTFGINDANLIQSGDTEEAFEDLTQYGTLTFAGSYSLFRLAAKLIQNNPKSNLPNLHLCTLLR